MIVCIEGPEKAGKSTLARSVLANFAPKRSRYVKCSGRDPQDGFGYLDDFLVGVDSSTVEVWDRAWIGEVVYGRLLKQDRRFASDEFLAEWIYGRPLLHRGGRFVLLPYSPSQLEERRDDTDLPVSPFDEDREFSAYAETWGYDVLINDYSHGSLAANRIDCQRSVFLDLHGLHSSLYVGPKNPALTFVEVEPFNDTRLAKRFPFGSLVAADYFRPFGVEAVLGFGYTTMEGVKAIHDAGQAETLLARPVTISRYPTELGFPQVSWRLDQPNQGDIRAFRQVVDAIAKEYGVNDNPE